MLLIFTGCQEDYQPKPEGYFRIGLPTKEYAELRSDCPYTFEINTSAQWQQKSNCWADVRYSSIRATVQLTYKAIEGEEDFRKMLNESQDLAYKHSVKAQGIAEKQFSNPTKNIYGLLYNMQGNTASSTQFFMTDSTQHFLRGVLYFYSVPNADSLKPVNEFMFDEMVHMIETLEWKNSSP